MKMHTVTDRLLFSLLDYIKSCASLEVCRQVIVAFDSSGLGRITFSNFKDLMCSLKLWHGVFKNHSKEKSGILKGKLDISRILSARGCL